MVTTTRIYNYKIGLFCRQCCPQWNNQKPKTRALKKSKVATVALLFAYVFTMPLSISSAYAENNTATITDKDVLILDFELNDLTLNPATDKETKRTALLRPMLSDALKEDYGWTIKDLDPDTRASAQKGKGYLFDRPPVAGELGRTANARWVVSGRLHKASFLFVYLKAQLIDTETLTLKADFVVEIKGAAPKLTRKGVDALALQVSDTIKGLLADSSQ